MLMLENLRFHPGEEANDPDFAAALGELGDIYVGDAFSCAHRAHASVEALPRQMAAAGKPVCAGRSMGAELAALDAALSNPARPVVAVVGGAKVSTKLQILENLVTRVDGIVLGGGMANTFLLAQGHDVGASLVEADMVETASSIMAAATANQCRLILPVDALVAREFAAGAPHRIAAIDAVSDDEMILDVGPHSITAVTDFITSCRTIVWNGPMGAFEIAPFDTGTNAVAQAVAARTVAGDLLSIAGGGDTMAALANAGSSDQFTYISTAGGAFLEWLEGKTLPGVEALQIAG
jgi:phosphoglycerate kinase